VEGARRSVTETQTLAASDSVIQPTELARYIEHTNLQPNATTNDIKQLCQQAVAYAFLGVCVNSGRVGLCRSLLAGADTLLVATVGFPMGAASTESKLTEARQAIRDGARELDMMIDIGRFLDGNTDFTSHEVAALSKVAHSEGTRLKAIIETGFLNNSSIEAASRLVKEAGADFVKTNTGYGPRGVTVDDVRTIRSAIGPGMGIKAAGGIRTYVLAIDLVRAGATRLGCSSSVDLIQLK